MAKGTKMKNIIYIVISFILGILTGWFTFLIELVGLNLKNLKKFWKLLIG
jgi:hypothetical protein